MEEVGGGGRDGGGNQIEKWVGGGGGGNKISASHKDKVRCKSATHVSDVQGVYKFGFLFCHFIGLCQALHIKLFLFAALRVCVCVRACMSACARACVRLIEMRGRGIRAWPCIIHEADLEEESRGSAALL